MRAFIFSFCADVERRLWRRARNGPRVSSPLTCTIGQGDKFKLTDCDDACGLKYYTLAFIIARQEGNRTNATYASEPAWDGRIPMEQNLY